MCEDVPAALSLDVPVEEHLAELVRGLDAGWKQPASVLRRRGRRRRRGPAAGVSVEVHPEAPELDEDEDESVGSK